VGRELDDGRSISMLVWGDAPPEIVLIHGGAQNAHTWDTVALALGRSLVAPDLPGHGHSDSPAPGVGTAPAANAADLVPVLEAFAAGAEVVVGMSLGGLTAIALGAVRQITEHPGRDHLAQVGAEIGVSVIVSEA